MSNKRALWALIPAAILCSVLLVGLEQSGRQSIAPTLDATVNPLGATVASLTASAQSVATETAGNGGDGGRRGDLYTVSTPTPASTTEAEVAQRTEQRLAEPQGAGSSPVLSANNLKSAIAAAFPPSEQATAYRVAMCESRGDPTEVGAAGEEGAFQVRAKYHGPVPADIYGQAQQAARIVATAGWSPWSCA